MGVSVYIPCYNAAATVAACIDSLLKQRFPISEVLVIDDGSTDDTVVCAAQYPVRILRHATNRGIAAARNTAIAASSGEYIASIDADCIADESWLERLMPLFSYSDIAAVGGKVVERSTVPADQWRASVLRQHWGAEQRFVPFLYGANTVFRRSVLCEVSCYQERYRTNFEDYDICRRLKEKSYRFFYTPDAVVAHQKSDTLYSVIHSYWRWHQYFFEESGFYTTTTRLGDKLQDNVGLSMRLMQQHIQEESWDIVGIDFLLFLLVSLLDIRFYQSQHECWDAEPCSLLSSWLVSFDMALALHMASAQDTEACSTSFIIPQRFFERLIYTLTVSVLSFMHSHGFSDDDMYMTACFFLRVITMDQSDCIAGRLVSMAASGHAWKHCILKPALLPHEDALYRAAYESIDQFYQWVGGVFTRYPDIRSRIAKGAALFVPVETHML